MKQQLKILMVDDHPMIITGYKLSLENLEMEQPLLIDVSYNIDDANRKIMDSKNSPPYGIIFLDINMPISKSGVFTDGEDLGIKIKRQFPKTKIVVLTMLSNNYRINTIMKNINPHGFLIKSNLTPKKLQEAFIEIEKGNSYYCEIVNNLVRKRMSSEIDIDSLDRKILYHLSLGKKTKNLPNFIPLSMPTIERRKRKLKNIFEVSGEGDSFLLAKAKEKGFV